MAAVTLLGLLAAFCTTLAFLPQAVKTLKTRHTRDLSLPMYALFVGGVSLWVAYGLILGDAPLIIGNTVTLVFAGIVLVLKIRHG